MSFNEKLLSLTEGDNLDHASSTLVGTTVFSDREVFPDQLSTDHGEGHGKGKGAKKASVFGSAMNIANTIMGAGILALPNVISQFGILMGSVIIVGSFILTFISCSLLLKAKNLSHHSKYISIGKHCFGTKGLWAVKIIIIVNNIGLCIAYLIIFSTVGQNLIAGFDSTCKVGGSSNPFYCEDWFLTLAASILVTPFVFARSMAKLQGASFVAVLAAVIFSIITIEHFFTVLAQDQLANDIHVLPHVGNIVTALSSITSVFLAFTFQFNFFPVYKTLENPSDRKMKKTTLIGLTIVLTVYLSVANCGYMTFGNNSSDLLENFTRENLGLVTFIIINVAFLVSSTLTLPLMFFGAKNEVYGAIKLIRKRFRKGRVQQEESSIEVEEDEKTIEEKYGFKGYRFNIYVGVLFAFIVLLAIAVPGINLVFSFVGSTAANGLNFLLPPMFYLRLASKKGKLRMIAMFMLGLGVVMAFVGVISSALTTTI